MEDFRPSPKEFFSKHADHYAASQGHAAGADLAQLMALLRPASTETALDVATGTGFTAMELATRVKSVVATDITEEMLEQAKRLAAQRGIDNISFEEAEASTIPYPDSSFDIVTSRRAPHHFGDIPAFLRQARRVLKPGGRLGIADMSPPEGSEEFFNRLELIRDSTHRRALTLSRWIGAIEEAELSVVAAEILTKPVSFQEWMNPVPMGREEQARVSDEWGRAPLRTCRALELRMANGRIEGWTKRWAVIVARRR